MKSKKLNDKWDFFWLSFIIKDDDEIWGKSDWLLDENQLQLLGGEFFQSLISVVKIKIKISCKEKFSVIDWIIRLTISCKRKLKNLIKKKSFLSSLVVKDA